MKTILRTHLPVTYKYYRSSTSIFYSYYHKKLSHNVIHFPNGGESFFHATRILGKFYIISLIKNDALPSKEFLIKHGIKHGIIWWSPLRESQKPAGWIRLPKWYTKHYLHSSRSAFCILDTPNYWEKWSMSTRNHRKQILRKIQSGQIIIQKTTDLDTFLQYFQKHETRNPHKWIVYRTTKKLFEDALAKDYRIFLIYVNGIVEAGAVFLDDGKLSEYWASFYSKNALHHHLGVAMMDSWLSDSYVAGFSLCDLDHMRDSGQSRGFIGYTKFKENFADYDVYFHDTWLKFF